MARITRCGSPIHTFGGLPKVGSAASEIRQEPDYEAALAALK